MQENYRAFHKWSIEHLSEFWTEIWEFTGVVCSKKYDTVSKVIKRLFQDFLKLY